MRNLNLNQARDLNDVTREIEINLNGGADGAAVSAASQNPQGRADRQRLVRPGFHALPRVAGLLRNEGCNSLVHSIPAHTNGGYGRYRGRAGPARRRDAAAPRRVRGGNKGAEGNGCEGPRQARDFQY